MHLIMIINKSGDEAPSAPELLKKVQWTCPYITTTIMRINNNNQAKKRIDQQLQEGC